MTTTITDEGALAMLREAEDLVARMQTVADRAASAFDDLAAGQDVVEPTSVQRVLMTVAQCAPQQDVVDALNEATQGQ